MDVKFAGASCPKYLQDAAAFAMGRDGGSCAALGPRRALGGG